MKGSYTSPPLQPHTVAPHPYLHPAPQLAYFKTHMVRTWRNMRGVSLSPFQRQLSTLLLLGSGDAMQGFLDRRHTA